MDPHLKAELEDRLLRNEKASPELVALIEAACESEKALTACIAKPSAPRPEPEEREESAAPPHHPGVFLEELTVRGFRGIGAPARLSIPSGPGLTLVVGRNGCGKSSFAEAFETLLTSESRRWAGMSKVWTEGWRNLHASEARIDAKLTLEGAGEIHARRSWSADAGLAESTFTSTRSLEELGWASALHEYRPFLSYVELGALVREPSKIYDALHRGLGLEELGMARKRVKDAHRELDQRRKTARMGTSAQLGAMRSLEDERAARCVAALDRKVPDLDALESIVLGARSGDDTQLGTLGRLASIRVPALDQWEATARALAEARDARAELVDATSARHADLSRLLAKALELIDGAPDACPVCTRPLDEPTIAAIRKQQKDSVFLAQRFREADEAHSSALRAATQLARGVPLDLSAKASAADLGDEAHAACLALHAALEAEETGLDAALRMHGGALVGAAEAIRKAASEQLAELDAAFKPKARALSKWLDEARQVETEDPTRRLLKNADDWLKDAEAEIRTARFQPIADEVQRLWRKLGQQSDVDLAGIQLMGHGKRRSVRLDARVGTSEAPALAIMSQGELSALALALFLPRTGLPESPFRFVVIDDPVQAMDLVKVDGLAEVLGEAARTRQVIVFTHDERLAEAVRRLHIDAAVLRVGRRGGSTVEVTEQRGAVDAYLDDAWAVAKSDGIGAKLAERVVPGFCRGALEAAAVAAYRRRHLRNGESHRAIEDTLGEAHTLSQHLALALFDDASHGGRILGEVNARVGREAGDCLQACKKGAHAPIADYLSLIDQTRKLAHYVESRP